MNLDQRQQAILASFIHTDGFKIVCELLKDEVLKFNRELLEQKKPEDVIIAHNRAAVSADMYEGFLDRINSEVYFYTNLPKSGDKPVDITEGVLDIESYVRGE